MLGLLGDKKKMVGAIVGEYKPKEVPMVEELDVTPALKAVSQDIINAIKDGNADALSSALKEHYMLCEKEEEYQESEE